MEREADAERKAGDDVPEAVGEAEDASPAAPEAPQAEEIERLRREAAEYLDLLQRLKADFDNFRRRSSRELAESRRAGAADFVRDLLPVLDSLERAAASGDDGPGLRQGLEMTLKQLRAVLSRAGVERVEAEGRTFDPSVHEALMSVPAGDRPAGVVVQVFEEGYKMGDRLLRPARVAVTADVEPPSADGPDEERGGEETTDG